MATATMSTPIRLFETGAKVILIKEPWLDAWAKTRACDSALNFLQKWLEDEYLAYLDNERWRGSTAPLPEAGDMPPADQTWVKVTRDQEDRIIAALLGGMKIGPCHERFHRSETTIRRIWKKRGPSAETIQRILFLNDDYHFSGGVPAIAKAVGVSESIVRTVLANHKPLVRQSGNVYAHPARPGGWNRYARA